MTPLQLQPERAGRWLLAGCLTLNLAFSLVGLTQSLEEVHVFRQLQTALTARSILEDGWRIAYPTPLFGPPWSVPMEFPLYQLCVAKLSAWTRLPLEPAGRLVSLGFLYSLIPALLGLAAELRLAPARRWLLPAAVLLSPVYLYYGRTFMIESCALAAATWFLFAFLRAVRSGSTGWLVAAMALGGLAGLAKITTWMVFLLPAAGWTLWQIISAARAGENSRRWWTPAIRAGMAVLPGMVVALAWVHFSDGVKASNPFSTHLTSAALRTFTFGTLAQRGSGDFWLRIFQLTTSTVLPLANLTIVALFAFLLVPAVRARALFCLAAFVGGPLLFANVYYVHDYYFAANAVFMCAVLVLAWNAVLDLEVFPQKTRRLVVAGSLAVQVVAFVTSYFPVQRHPLREPPEIGRIVAATTRPEDIVLVFGQDWDSATAYYSHRRTIMVLKNREDKLAQIDEVLSRVPHEEIGAMIVTGPLRSYPDYAKRFADQIGLPPRPALVSTDTIIFVAEDRLAEFHDTLNKIPLAGFRVSEPPEDDDAGVPRLRASEAELAAKPKLTELMRPRPVAIIYPFGLSISNLTGRDVFDAHAPTDLIFDLPVGAGVLEAEFGIIPDAYAGKNETDGVEFRVEWITPAGQRRQLHSVYLDPLRREADRGMKRMKLSLPKNARGQLWLRTLPGPQHNIACDWAYWGRIELR